MLKWSFRSQSWRWCFWALKWRNSEKSKFTGWFCSPAQVIKLVFSSSVFMEKEYCRVELFRRCFCRNAKVWLLVCLCPSFSGFCFPFSLLFFTFFNSFRTSCGRASVSTSTGLSGVKSSEKVRERARPVDRTGEPPQSPSREFKAAGERARHDRLFQSRLSDRKFSVSVENVPAEILVKKIPFDRIQRTELLIVFFLFSFPLNMPD